MKRYIKNGLLFFVSFLGILIFLEIFIQTTHITEKTFNEIYEDIGVGRRRNFNYILFNEGFSIGKFNKYRYLGPAYAPTKDTSVLRIALIGDSYVEGFQVFDRHHFRKVLEDQLSKKLNVSVEILNFGRSGFDLSDMYIYNRLFVNQFSPDYILFFTSNSDYYPNLNEAQEFKLRIVDSTLKIDKKLPQKFVNFYNRYKLIIQNSAILNMANIGVKVIKREGILPILLEDFYTIKKENPNKENPKRKEIPYVTKKILKELSLSRNTIIVNRDFDVLDSIKLSLIENYNIKYIDLTDTLFVLKNNGIHPYYWKATKKSGHWNQQAHEAIGIYLSDQLLNIIEEDPEY